MKIYYRLSDKGRRTGKPDFITLQNCLLQAKNVLPAKDFRIYADNIDPETKAFLLDHFEAEQIIETKLGNAGAFLFALSQCLEREADDEVVYMLEDDYLHVPGAPGVIEEGLEIADYVTLYDHPDKYGQESPNPLVKKGGEKGRVLLTKTCHWKETNSTCMTFAARVGTIRKDAHIMRRWSSISKVPKDYRMWRGILRFGRRRLISPIPGFATHGMTAYLAPHRNWPEILKLSLMSAGEKMK
jgi:hypothetical protein